MYYYYILSNLEKQAYDQIYHCYENMDEFVHIGKYNLTKNSLSQIFHMISKDHPEIFWIEMTYNSTIRRDTGIIQSFSPVYRMGRIKRDQMRKEIADSEKIFLNGIRFSMTPYEKALRLYENLPRLITYDYDATVGERKEKRRTKLDDCSTIYGALVLQKAVCGGYAKTYQYLLKKFGINSIVVNGATRRGRHSWNMLCLDNEWFHVDVTWGDLIKSFTDGYISYAWFCLPDRDVLSQRTPDEDVPLPVCASNSQNYYVKNKLYFLVLDYPAIERCISKEIYKNKYRKIQLRFSNADNMNTVWKYLTNNNTIFSLYKNNGIPIKLIWHNIDSELNVLTFWTEP